MEQLERVRVEQGIPGRTILDRDLPDFYLVAFHSRRHTEDILRQSFTPFELLNGPVKYRFYVRRWSTDQQITEV